MDVGQIKTRERAAAQPLPQEADWANSLGYWPQQGAVGKSGFGKGKDDPRAKAKARTTGRRTAQPARARASVLLARARFVKTSDTTAHVRPASVPSDWPRQRKSTQPKVEDIGLRGKERAKVRSATAKANTKAKRVRTQSTEEMRPSGSHRPVRQRKNWPRMMSTPERFMTKMMR